MNSSRLRLAILWLPLAFAVRLYWVRHGAISYTSDTAILDLMARHLQHGQWTPYFWGQNYYGTLDSCVLAAMFALFGMKIFVSQMFPLIAWLIFLILCHRYILSTESIL
ncbi:MAG TPA: hypothetical protein VMU17_01410, partial [Elusimicrobiota bacterium]|nr:hypothetical protein [Elusimicrobiota bacterium]